MAQPSSTKVVIGYASESWSSKDGLWYDTHIGGHPVWPEGLEPNIHNCPKCTAQRRLVLQAYAPHPSHPERSIYIFGCNSILCSADASSWCSIRVCKVASEAQSVEEPQESVPSEKKQVEINWDSDSETESESLLEDLADDLKTLSLEVELMRARKEAATEASYDVLSTSPLRVRNDKVAAPPNASDKTKKQGQFNGEPNGQSSEGKGRDNIATFKSYYVEVDYEPETSKDVVQESSVNGLLHRYEEEERIRSTQGTLETYAAEKDDETPAERHFESFQERIARAPAQVLRYQFGAQPLWPRYPSPKLEEPNTKCNCGADMVFELQLLGSCLHYLQPDQSITGTQKEAGMNFASIAVFTCAADCTEASLVSENRSFRVFHQTVLVQQDEW